MRSLLSGLILLAILPGCARYQSFRVTDAQSGQPLEGVQTERLEGGLRLSPMPFVLMDSLSPVERQSTDSSGAAKFKAKGSKFAVNPQSSMPGFDRAFVMTTSSGVKILYPDERREVYVKPIDGVVEVPLHRAASPRERESARSLGSRSSLSNASSTRTSFDSALR